MEGNIFSFLADAPFVIPWFAFGLLAALWVAYDEYTRNKHVNQALKWAWPIIIFFFSILGLLAYIITCRPPGIDEVTGEEAKKVHHQYVEAHWKKVMGSVAHCVGGDGLGIVTAMIAARILNFGFWTEFWVEYAVGFAFGLFIFQWKAMLNMDNPALQALWKAGRAEFFSMFTVMAGMGFVMRYVTPAVVGEVPPDPDQAAFWGFAMLGLLFGTVVTFPMNWWLVSRGWKHGMS
jgi:hypothetical protein